MTSRRLIDPGQPIDSHIPKDYNKYMTQLLSRNLSDEKSKKQVSADSQQLMITASKKTTLQDVNFSDGDSDSLTEENRDDIASLHGGKEAKVRQQNESIKNSKKSESEQPLLS